MRRKPYRIKLLTLAGILVLGVLSSAYLVGLPSKDQQKFRSAYRSLEVGVSRGFVITQFSRPADYRCRIHGASFEYYKPPDPTFRFIDFRGEIDESQYEKDGEFTKIEDLPDPYDYVVIVYDADEKVIAYTHIGEELHVHTKAKGKISGASVHVLTLDDITTPTAGILLRQGYGGQIRESRQRKTLHDQ